MSTVFDQARQLFALGVADFEAGRLAPAEARFEAALALVPGRVSILVNLAAVRIELDRPAAALPLLDEALAGQPDAIDARLHRSLALGDLGRHAEALDELNRVLALAADHPAASYHRARTLGALGRLAQALAAFERALALAPEHALAWFGHGQTLQRLDRPTEALASFDRALGIAPQLAQAWTQRGTILKDLGRSAEASDAFARSIAQGGDAALNGYYLAALSGQGIPERAPRQYVEGLFDDYAASFDSHVVGTLAYRGHQVLIGQLQALGRTRWHSALDLGCGTGLCGPLMREVCDRVDGVDLSAAMLDQARALGVYRRLEQADLVEHLQRCEPGYDLVVAADVFIYVGALAGVFSGVKRVLQPGGMFCFSIEQAPDAVDFELRASLRYAHSQRYIDRLALQCGFEVLRLHRQAIREEQRRPIAGLFVCLRKS